MKPHQFNLEMNSFGLESPSSNHVSYLGIQVSYFVFIKCFL